MVELARARGAYEYTLNGEATDIRETWECIGDLAGECQITSQRIAPGVSIDVEAHLTSGQVSWFDVTWHSEGAQVIHALYKLRGEALVVSRRQGNAPLQDEEIRFLEDESPPLLYPLMRIFTGPLIDSLLKSGGEGGVAIPSIANPSDQDKLLQPQLTHRRARVTDKQVWLVREGREISCRCCEFSGDQYGPESRFWLGEDNLLIRYQWQQGADQNWDVWLRQSALAEKAF